MLFQERKKIVKNSIPCWDNKSIAMKKSETGRFFMMNSFIDFPEDNKNKDHCFILRNSPYGTE